MPADIDILLRVIEQKLGWGDSTAWQTRDFEHLQQLILDNTGVSLSASTLRRVWGRVRYNSLPSATTLDTLARFAGAAGWRQFVKEHGVTEPAFTNKAAAEKAGLQEQIVVNEPARNNNAAANSLPAAAVNRRPFKIVWLLAGSVAVSLTLLGIFALKKTPPPVNKNDYSFTVKPVTRGIPNSVIFNYNAAAAPSDDVYIQQSWDKRKRALVSKTQHTHTSIYYEPGFYQAKLVVDNRVVKEAPLLVPTAGWLGLIGKKPVPVYLPTTAFMDSAMLRLPLAAITARNIGLQPEPPLVSFYNVGNFTPVPLSDFAFSACIKNEYGEGTAACQFSAITLITDAAPIIIPLSVKGCVSELSLLSADSMISGKQADLSGFGADFSNWVQVGCQGTGNNIRYTVNGQVAYTCPLPGKPVHIVGMMYSFRGTGAVKDIRLYRQNKTVFRAF